LSYDQPARDRHPTVMWIVFALLFFEVGDGLVALSACEKPALHSAHSSTAVLGLLLMATMAGLSSVMGSSSSARTAHAYLGVITVLVLSAHAYFGVTLGLSL